MNYKEKLKAIINSNKTPLVDIDTFLKYFPELKEDEDEKVRKTLIRFFKDSYHNETEMYGVTVGKALAWLEKQGEQKSIWHNEDEEPQRGSLILLIMQSGTPIVAKIIEPNHTFNHGERWAYIDDLLEKQGEQKPTDKVESNKKFTPIESALKDLICDVDNSYTIEQVRRFLFEYDYKNKILNAAKEEMQTPAWSEEDEKIAKTIINEFEQCSEWCCANGLTKEDCIAWLKSLKPQNRWKPTKQQLSELRCVISGCSFETSILVELEENLKKLL